MQFSSQAISREGSCRVEKKKVVSMLLLLVVMGNFEMELRAFS